MGATKNKCDKDLDDAAALIVKLEKILKQERTRWGNIHNNPISDEVSIETDQEKREVRIRVVIDTRIKNEINSKPITRTYTLKLKDEHSSLVSHIDLLIGGGWAYGSGIRPVLGIGYRPFTTITSVPVIRDLGIAAFSSIYTSGASIYVAPREISPFMIAATAGFDWEGHFRPGFGIGIRF